MKPDQNAKLLEVCIDTPQALDACIAGGADRVELCSALGLGGLTPGPGLMAAAGRSDITAHVMIRPVPGGFVADNSTFDAMLEDVAAAQSHNLAGVVIGVLTPERALDLPRLNRLITAADGMDVTLHRAIDLCADPLEAIDQAIELGLKRVLTSGCALRAVDGVKMIHAMVTRAAGRIEIMAGSGITSQNVGKLVAATGVGAVHASCATSVSENEDIFAFGFGGKTRRQTDVTAVSAMRAALDGS